MDQRRQEQPSRATDTFWIDAEDPPAPPATRRSGKWLLFMPRDQIDEAWATVARAVVEGRLGGRAKVSTARPNPNASRRDRHVICVYTRDSKDEADVMRVREELRRLGFIATIPYKTDEATLAGRYAVRGDRRISKYQC